MHTATAPTMTVTNIDYAATGAFSQILIDYLNQDEKVKPFFNRFPEIDAFSEQIQEKEPQFTQEQRQVLHQELLKQYEGLQLHPAVRQNIGLLSEPNTFTVTTGHQLNLFTGPLYFVYKILTAINACETLRQQYPQYNFVPVYWMATEDHDFAEINHFNLFGKRYEWQTEQQGAVGRFSTEGIQELLAALPEQYPAFAEAYTQQPNLAAATRALTHTLFGEYGLVSVDADSVALKQALKPVIQAELEEQASNAAVNEVNVTLAAHYKPQIHSRPINLFYLDGNLRERIVEEDGVFKVLNTDLQLSKEEILELAAQEPEKFSPNVVLRPLYQELVLPNLAYIGGGAEVAYWLQLGQLFRRLRVPFPMLMLRNSALYISKPNAARMHKLNLQPLDLFQDVVELKKQIAAQQAGEEDISLEAQKQALAHVFEQVKQLAEQVEPTLAKAVAGEAQKAQNALEVLEKKITKARDSRYETLFSQVQNLKEKLFPNGSLQERTDNLLSFQTNNPQFIQNVKEAFNPFDYRFTVIEEN